MAKTVAAKKRQTQPKADERISILHARRWRAVSDRFPRRVAEAYGGDIERALGDTDAQVVATVAAWEREQGQRPFDWHTQGVRDADPSDEDYAHRLEVAKAAKRYRRLEPVTPAVRGRR